MGFSNLFSDFFSFSELHAEAPPDEPDSEGGAEEDEEEGKETGDGDGEEDESGGDAGEGDEEEEDDDEEEEEEDDEPVDPKPKLEEECSRSAQCAPLKHHFDECAERVHEQENNPDHKGPKEDCVEEFFHLQHCAAACAAPKLFKALK